MKRRSVYGIPDKTWRAAKSRAAANGQTLSGFLEQAIKTKLGERMDISQELQHARVHGVPEVAVDATVEDVVHWLQEELGRVVEPDVDYFVSQTDINTDGNKFRNVSFADETGIDLCVIVNG